MSGMTVGPVEEAAAAPVEEAAAEEGPVDDDIDAAAADPPVELTGQVPITTFNAAPMAPPEQAT